MPLITMSFLSSALAHTHKLTKHTPRTTSPNDASYARSKLTMASDNTISAAMPRASASKPENRHAFLTSFPRELRDKIYDLIISEKEKVFMDTWYRTRSRVPKARILSRQLKSEYDERCPVNKHLQIFECHSILGAPLLHLEDPAPPQATRATSVQYHLIWCEDRPDSDMICGNAFVESYWPRYRCQIRWHLRALPYLEQFDITISCGSLTCALAIAASSEIYGTWGSTLAHPRVSLLRPPPVYDPEFVHEFEPHPSTFFED
jgi:hypothetical protein